MKKYPNYLMVNHVPFGKSECDDTFKVGDMWLEDLRAQKRAIGPHGRLLVATPLHEHLAEEDSGSFNLVEFKPREEGIVYFPLPPYLNTQEYLLRYAQLRRCLSEAVSHSDIVQADYGGHPVPLGRVVWDIAGKQNKKRIWLFDGADPMPRMELGVAHESNSLKRWAKRAMVKSSLKFFQRAVAQADLVFTHNEAVTAHLTQVWHEDCHVLHRSFVRDEIVVGSQQIRQRADRWNNTARPLRLVVAGRQIAIKATDHVLRALAQARSRGAAIELVVLGEGEELENNRRLAKDLGIEGAVDFRGKVAYGEALFNEWDTCDAMVIANLTAEISRNFFLSLARGLPVIMYRNPATDALVESSQAGLLVEHGSVEGLAAAFERLYHDRSLVNRAAANGVELARQHTLDNCHRRRASLAMQCVAA
jgi:glycosyltransferase involved in cell wall biosynthesis